MSTSPESRETAPADAARSLSVSRCHAAPAERAAAALTQLGPSNGSATRRRPEEEGTREKAGRRRRPRARRDSPPRRTQASHHAESPDRPVRDRRGGTRAGAGGPRAAAFWRRLLPPHSIVGASWSWAAHGAAPIDGIDGASHRWRVVKLPDGRRRAINLSAAKRKLFKTATARTTRVLIKV